MKMANTARETVLSETGGAIGISSELRAVVDAWPMLSDRERRTILEMVQASSAGRNPD